MGNDGRQGGSPEPHLLIHDDEISTFEDDSFEHKAHVETLERVIDGVEPSWHIGLFGEWGAGKSTIIRLLYERIRESKTSIDYDSEIESSPRDFTGTLCIKTDAWKHAEDSIRTELVLDLNEGMAKELEQVIGEAAYPPDGSTGPGENPDGILDSDDIINELHDAEEKEAELERSLDEVYQELGLIGKISGGITLGLFGLIALSYFGVVPVSLRGLLSTLVGSGILLTVLSYLFTEFREARYEVDRKVANPRKDWSGAYERLFDDIVSTASDRYEAETGQPIDKVVITVDDVDRCESETAYEILIALKSFLNHDDCIFIIPCDEDALYKHLEGVNEGAYLKNTVNQQSFLSKFFETELEIPEPTQEQLDGFAEEQRSKVADEIPPYVLEVLLSADLATPRRITRALNRYVTLRHLAMYRQNSSVDLDRQEHERFLAKVSILQEDFPHFHAALERDASQLAEVYQEWESGLGATGHPGTDPLFDDMGIPMERREPLIDYLSATQDVSVDDPQPFFSLSGSPQEFESRFAERLKQGRVAALEAMLQGTDSDEDLEAAVDHMAEQLTNTATRYDVFKTVLKVAGSLPDDEREAIAGTVHEVVVDSEATQIMEGIEFTEFEAVLEELDPDDEMPDILTAYVESIIDGETGVDEARFASLIRSEQVQEVLRNEGIQGEFSQRLIDAYHGGMLSRAEYDQILTTLKAECTALYTPQLVKAR